MVRRSVKRMVVAAAVVVGIAGTARADAIDGEWCHGSNHFAIDGPNITTPGGNRIQGNYSRHGFDYVVPANEPGAGGRIDMVRLNEETMQLVRVGAGGAPEIWRRCRPTS